MKVFMWFFANPETETTYKIYAVAEDAGAARRNVLRMPHDPAIKQFIVKTEPSSFDVPWTEINASRQGKAMSYYR